MARRGREKTELNENLAPGVSRRREQCATAASFVVLPRETAVDFRRSDHARI